MSSPTGPDVVLRRIAETLRSDPARAAQLSEAALAMGVRHPLLHHARAMWLAAQSRHDEALAAFRQADAMPPPNIATRSAMAASLTALGRRAEAIGVLDAAIALGPQLAGLHIQKGLALELDGELEAARAAHACALELQPDNNEARARLSFLAARRGAWAEAAADAERVLKAGHDAAAHLALAMCSLEKKDADAAERHLRAVLDDGAARPTNRYLALGLMGDVHDLRGDVEQAFGTWQAAKQTELERRPISSPTMFDAVTGLIKHVAQLPAMELPRSHDRPSPHIFVFGFLRSGTTLIQQVLASRDDVLLLQEKETLADAMRAFMAKPQDLDRLWTADDAILAPYRELYWQKVSGFVAGTTGRALVDGMPINTIKLPLIARLFPEAGLVFVLRDPRDVVLSCCRRSFVRNATTDQLLTLEGAARFYDAVMRLAELYRSKLPVKLHLIRLEDVIADFDGQMRALCAVTGLAWTDSMRDFAERAKSRGIATPSGAQVARGLNADGVGVWRRYRRFLAPVSDILAPWVERFGYDPEDAAPRCAGLDVGKIA